MNLLTCLESFVTIANSQSFSIAARKLNVSPSKLSKEITWLENKLDTKLFIRSTRQLNLTENGKVLYTKATKIFNDVDEIKDITKSNNKDLQGLLRVYLTVTPAVSYLTSLSIQFMEANPKVEVALFVTGEVANPYENFFDIAVSFDDIKHPKYDSKLLFSVQSSVYASPEYLNQRGTPHSVEDLIRHNCLINNLYGNSNKWMLGKKAIQVAGNFKSNNAGVLKQAALAGVGLILVPSFTVKEEVRQGSLIQLLKDEISPELLIYYSYPKHMEDSKLVLSLIDFYQKQAIKDQFVN